MSRSECMYPNTYNLRHAENRMKSIGNPLKGRFKILPVDLFRVQNGKNVILRDKRVQDKYGRTTYDLTTDNEGKVNPKPSNIFQGPNGMSLRPLGSMLQNIILGFKGKDMRIYQLPKGSELPKDLVLLHEHSDHYSLQCDKEMSVEELNAKLTDYINSVCPKHMTRKEFIESYPHHHQEYQ